MNYYQRTSIRNIFEHNAKYVILQQLDEIILKILGVTATDLPLTAITYILSIPLCILIFFVVLVAVFILDQTFVNSHRWLEI